MADMDKTANNPVSGPTADEWKKHFDSIPDFVSFLTPDFRFKQVNRALADFLGKTPEELAGKKCHEAIHGSKQPIPYCPGSEVLSSGRPVQRDIYEPKTGLHLEVKVAPVFDDKGKIQGIVHIARAITERMKIERELEKSETRFRELVNNMSSGVAVYEAVTDGEDFVFRDFNRAGEKIDLVKKQDVIGEKVTEAFPGVMDFGLLDVFRRVWKTGKPEHHPISLYRDDRITGWRENYVYKLPSGEIVAVYDDITGRKESERVMAESEKKYRELYDNAPDMYYSINKDGVITDCNATFERMLGYKRKSILGKHLTRFFTEKSRRLFLDFFPNINSESGLLNLERDFIRKDGSVLPVILNIYIEKDANGNLAGTRAIARDITERKRAEVKLREAYRRLKRTQEMLIQSGKMAAMGQLASGISHELNQPLTGIKGFAQAVLSDLDENSPMRTDLSKIVEQADRMDMIIRHVRFFARKSDFFREDIDLNRPIEDALTLLGEQLRLHNIKVEKSLSRRLPKIQGDRNSLEQAFINLITNAKDAVKCLNNPAGGTLKIKSSASKNRKNVEIIFADTGCGITVEDAKKIFDPFYTTKSPDGGMGLGLSLVYRIIENHEGAIEVKSHAGTGSIFRITFPVNRFVE